VIETRKTCARLNYYRHAEQRKRGENGGP